MNFWGDDEFEHLAEESSENEETGENPEDSEEETGSDHSDDLIKIYMDEVKKNKLLTAEEERDLGRRVAEGDQAARDRMVQANLRLVIKMAKRYMNRGLPFLDLIEEGNVGLIKAVDKFNFEKGFRFSTYATWWIRQSIERALINQGRTIRLPVHVTDQVSKMLKIDRDLRSRTQREPRTEEIAEVMGVAPGQVEHLLRVARKTFSIEHPMGENSDYTLVDTLEDKSTVDPGALAEDLQDYDKVNDLLQNLTETERKIMNFRYGLDGREPQTLDSLGKELGVTRERVRQIQARILGKLQESMNEAEEEETAQSFGTEDASATGEEDEPEPADS